MGRSFAIKDLFLHHWSVYLEFLRPPRVFGLVSTLRSGLDDTTSSLLLTGRPPITVSCSLFSKFCVCVTFLSLRELSLIVDLPNGHFVSISDPVSVRTAHLDLRVTIWLLTCSLTFDTKTIFWGSLFAVNMQKQKKKKRDHTFMSRISNKGTFIILKVSLHSFIHSFTTRRRRLTQNRIAHIHLKIFSHTCTEDSSVQRRGRSLCSTQIVRGVFDPRQQIQFHLCDPFSACENTRAETRAEMFPLNEGTSVFKNTVQTEKVPLLSIQKHFFKKKKKKQPPRWPSPAAPDDGVIKL